MALRYGEVYGGFSADGWQYEVHTPSPPREWFNCLFNRAFVTFVSQTGRGVSFRPGPPAMPVSPAHRAFYLRDRETGEVWSPTGAPAGGPPVEFRCLHRPDCTVIESERSGIRCRIRVFVPVEGAFALWSVTLRNPTAERRALSLFSFFPLAPGRGAGRGVPPEAAGPREAAEARFDPALGAILARRTAREDPGADPWIVYAAARPAPDHAEAGEDAFLGGARRWDRPTAVLDGTLADGSALDEPACAAFQHDLLLEQDQRFTVNLVLGCAADRGTLARELARFADPEGLEALFEECWVHWQERIGPGWLHTPDEGVNLALNVWLKRQLLLQSAARRWGERVVARDLVQDAVGALPFEPAECRKVLLEVFSRQESSGFVPPAWPTTGGTPTGAKGSCAGGPPRPRDAPAWAAWALAAYVNETGQADFLEETVPFGDRRRPATLLEHALAGLRFLAGAVGRHGLCLAGGGDWNEAVAPAEAASPAGDVEEGEEEVEEGESVWSSLALAFAARALAAAAARAGRPGSADELARIARRAADAVDAAAWDGAWYIRGYTPGGRRFGTHGESAGRIYLAPQAWAVLAGAADRERGRSALESVRRHLETALGPVLLAPPYTRPVRGVGPVSAVPPGTGSNGTVSTAGALHYACALAAAGEGGRALDVFRRILPAAGESPAGRSGQVPIWMPPGYAPPDGGHPGRAAPGIFSSAVPWCFLFVREYLFGVRAEPAGLRVRPNLPADWRECRLVRPFRGEEYEITIRNPAGLAAGRVRLELDGRPLEGDLVPFVGDGRHHAVTATLEPVAEAGGDVPEGEEGG